MTSSRLYLFFFFNDTATTEIYTLSLHDALPICPQACSRRHGSAGCHCPSAVSHQRSVWPGQCRDYPSVASDRKSTRLNSSHANISYAVFCLKKKKHKDA